ncbi:MAG: hypothetical protein K2X66_12890 [Cyanobacteria bacterium]|nr:hypothetical protein [Cyanobacteriota bacterium]
MPDEINHKVVSIFQKHRRGEQFHFDVDEGGVLVICPDGFNYVSYKLDSLPNLEGEETLLELASKKHYIVKILEQHKGSDFINNYYISGEQLSDFLLSLANRPGKVVEIERFYPDHTA